ncbi:HTH-type transcriptional regulator DmlR [Vibrio aerogenes CECT 7868]|uniref:HTH-type transcriptional regulator DmlR n=1 Tax=Vibrio aerogenes CECT 7868 TaxID=1216006 RepID=A0A1M5ZUA2_9VIBR|nr:LysR family transcriptional regulator [Vibrio aerogenes]SHI27718.1 HTH-type transcriptional regulator DmlR [Vibrio aerogenes CECT 7868]
MLSHPFSSLPVFIAVVESGSLSAAAQRLNITKSAVSKRLTQLESVLGVRLFHRTTRTIHLTEAGQRYYFHASQAYQCAQLGMDAVAELQGQPQGVLKITAPMSFGVRHIAPYIAEFMRLYPKIEIDLQLEDQMVDLVQGGFDMAIRIGHLPVSNLIAKRLVVCKSVLCAAPHYMSSNPEPRHPSDLRSHNCLTYAYFRGSEWRFYQKDKEFKVLPRGNLIINNSEGIRKATLDGLGIAQLPTFIVGKDLAQKKLQPLMTGYHLPEHAVYAVYPDRKYLPNKVRMFIEFLQQKYGQDIPYWDAGIS